MATPPVGIGDVVAGKYIIEHTIGEGGMGVVWAARHSELERRVAIKFLLPEYAQEGMAAERFRREARAAARMRGEHVCRVLDVGTLESGVPFMVMEHLEGRDLASELAAREHLPVEEAVGYVLEACEAVAEAHAAGIIHRDLKPANLFLETRSDGSRRVKVLDFGVSKSLLELKDGHSALTRTSSLVGSPLYMSPEQLDSARDVDARADVWALGVVLFELLTGVTPFQGDNIPQLVAAVLLDAPVRMTDLPVTLPSELQSVLQRALAKPRERRYASMAELAQALGPFASPSAQISIGRVRRLLDSKASAGADRDPTPAPGHRFSALPIQAATSDRGTNAAVIPRSAPRRWLPLVLCLVVAVGAALFFFWPVARPAAPYAAERPKAGSVAPSAPVLTPNVADAVVLEPSQLPTTAGQLDVVPSVGVEAPVQPKAAEPPARAKARDPKPGNESKPRTPPSAISDFGGRR